MEGEVCKGQQGRGRQAGSLGLGGYRKEGWRRVRSGGRARLGAGKAGRGRAED